MNTAIFKRWVFILRHVFSQCKRYIKIFSRSIVQHLYLLNRVQPAQKILRHLREKQPHLYQKVKTECGEEAAMIAQRAWQANENKHNETCSTLQHGAWSYEDDSDEKHQHLDVNEVLELLKDASDRGMNLLLNTGPLPDGSIHPKDVATLRKVREIMGHKI